MMERLKRSWEVTKVTFGVMRDDSELFLYPIFSSITGIVFLILMLFPLIFAFFTDAAIGFTSTTYIVIFGLYFGFALIKTFFDVATVYTAKERFAGNNATIKSSFGFAFSIFGRIIQWALLQAVVGVILNALRNAGSKKNGGVSLGQIAASILGAAWNIITLFVVPVIVYEKLNPFKSIKRSVEVLKHTWGESLVKYIGVAVFRTAINQVAFFLFIFPAILLLVFGQATGLAIVLIVVGILLFIANALVFSIAEKVYDTALYVYATTGKVPGRYSEEQLRNAVRTKEN